MIEMVPLGASQAGALSCQIGHLLTCPSVRDYHLAAREYRSAATVPGIAPFLWSSGYATIPLVAIGLR